MQHDGPPPQDAVPTPPTSLAHAGPDPDHAGAHAHQTVATDNTTWADNTPSGPGTDARDNEQLALTGHWHGPADGYHRTDDEFDRHTGRPQSQISQPLTGAGGPWAIRREHVNQAPQGFVGYLVRKRALTTPKCKQGMGKGGQEGSGPFRGAD